MQTKKTPNKDIFHAVIHSNIETTREVNIRNKMNLSINIHRNVLRDIQFNFQTNNGNF